MLSCSVSFNQDLNSPDGYSLPNGALKATDQIYNPRNLANRLERAGLVGVEAIPWARTPIGQCDQIRRQRRYQGSRLTLITLDELVKCADPISGIEIDIK